MIKGKRMILEQGEAGGQTESTKKPPEGFEAVQRIRDPSTPQQPRYREATTPLRVTFPKDDKAFSCSRYWRASTKSARRWSSWCWKPAACKPQPPTAKLPPRPHEY